jgi:hypothetical protein
MEVYELSVPFLLTSITITLTPKLWYAFEYDVVLDWTILIGTALIRKENKMQTTYLEAGVKISTAKNYQEINAYKRSRKLH